MADYKVKGKLGTGERFERLTGALKGRKGIYNPKGLAAWIGRRKYGAQKMAKMAAAGRKRG